MTLTLRQIEHLQAIIAEPGRSAYPGLNMGTLRSLAVRGLVRGSYPLGAIAMPRNAIRWTATDAGQKAATP